MTEIQDYTTDQSNLYTKIQNNHEVGELIKECFNNDGNSNNVQVKNNFKVHFQIFVGLYISNLCINFFINFFQLDTSTANTQECENQDNRSYENSLSWFAEICGTYNDVVNNIYINKNEENILLIESSKTETLTSSSNSPLTLNISNALESNNIEIETKEALLKELEEKKNIIESLQEQVTVINRKLQHVTKLYKGTKKKYNIEQKRLKRLQNMHIRSHEALSTRLRSDQLEALTRKSTHGLKWSFPTIREGLELKFKCGTHGYMAFLKRLPIYPSIRSLQITLQHIHFDSNILQDVFAMLQCEITKLQPQEKDCVIIMDEMAIKAEEVLDPSTQKFIGSCTFPTHSGIANKVLVFLLAGITTRWKYTVAYYFTKCVDVKYKQTKLNETGLALKDIILNIIEKSESIGFQVHAIISDMGTDNRAMWNAFEVGCSRDYVHVYIKHPIRTEDKLFFIPDPVHIFKNIASMLDYNKIIFFPSDICQSENLPYPHVQIQHLDRLMNYENNYELKIAFRLKNSNLHCRNQYKKMKVSTARAIFNVRTEAGLKLLMKNTNDSSIKTTAFFINLVAQWFNLITNRKRSLALSKHNMENYNKAIHHLEKTQNIFQVMIIGEKGHWKPVQTGVIMATTSILQLQDFFLNKRDYKFFLTGRLTQDCLENLFSLIRFKMPTPNALQVKQHLKAITIAQISCCSKVTSYDTDILDNELETIEMNFLQVSKQLANAKRKEKEIEIFMEASAIRVPQLEDFHLNLLDKWEWPIVYDLAGAVINSIKKNYNVCDNCFNAILCQGPNDHQYAFIVNLHSYKDNSLYKVSNICFKAIMKSEITFRQLRETLKTIEHVKIIDFLVQQLFYVWDGTNIPNCHNITTNILTRFFTMRLKMYNLKQKEEFLPENKRHTYNSKTMAMHVAVQ